MDNKEIRRANLATLEEEFGSLRALGDATETSPAYLSQIKNASNERGMGDDVARRFEEKLDKPHGWMDALQPPSPIQRVRDKPLPYTPRRDTVDIPVFDVAASMGLGTALPEYDTVVDNLRLTRSWLNRNLPGSTTMSNLAVISAIGTSMEPTFSDGDILLVDRAVSSIKLDAVYVLSFHDELYIKRIQRRPDGSLAIISDNKVYDPMVVAASDKESVHVLGRVLWAWNGKRL